MRPRLPLLFLLALTAPLADALAHRPGQSYLFLRIYDDSVSVRAEITAADLNRALHLGLPGRGTVSRREVDARLAEILAYVDARLELSAGGRAIPLRFTGYDFRHVEIADYVLLHYRIEAPPPGRLDVAYTVLLDEAPDHRNLLVIEHDWKNATFNNERIVSLVFSPSERRQPLDLSSSSFLRGFTGLVKLGTWHIWLGLDHILFLLALILPAVLYRENDRWNPVPSFRQALFNVAALVTIFTIAHSITLSLAALGVVRLPGRLVEPVIAGSIAIAAWHNLSPRFEQSNRVIAFAFGLFHGFGFAGILTEFGLERQYLAHSLLGFNLGVELGQIAILLAIFPLLYLLRTRDFYVPSFLRYASFALMGIAFLWLIERVLDVSFYAYTREMMARVM